MAAILRSSVIQTARRALSGEGTLSVRALHTGRNNPRAYASYAVEVDPLFKKIDVAARKELGVAYKKSLAHQSMAAFLRSTAIQTVRRAFSGEGTLSVRALHTGRNNPTAYASRAKKNLKPAEVDPLSKKIDDDSRKELLIAYTERVVPQKLSKHTLDEVVYYLVIMSAGAAFAVGHELGKNQLLAKKCQASNGKKARRVDDLS